ncbi:hypothetical protein CMEL01_13961 [Colletotrichum melonis]|uniref:Uncharacterized protein n=1 Tax=Colletotrichum melonis TaxID=1209925 RepID=A0AAI9UQJ7_9PEZI|nr:hypothetical protein CMEL01_13961 [Colletotrichum melonis]
MRDFDVIRSPYRSESDWSPYGLTQVGRVAPSSSPFAVQGIPSWCIPAASLHGISDVFCSTATEASCRFFLYSGLRVSLLVTLALKHCEIDRCLVL